MRPRETENLCAPRSAWYFRKRAAGRQPNLSDPSKDRRATDLIVVHDVLPRLAAAAGLASADGRLVRVHARALPVHDEGQQASLEGTGCRKRTRTDDNAGASSIDASREVGQAGVGQGQSPSARWACQEVCEGWMFEKDRSCERGLQPARGERNGPRSALASYQFKAVMQSSLTPMPAQYR